MIYFFKQLILDQGGFFPLLALPASASQSETRPRRDCSDFLDLFSIFRYIPSSMKIKIPISCQAVA